MYAECFLRTKEKDFLRVCFQMFTHPEVSVVQIKLCYLIIFVPDEVTDFLSLLVIQLHHIPVATVCFSSCRYSCQIFIGK